MVRTMTGARTLSIREAVKRIVEHVPPLGRLLDAWRRHRRVAAARDFIRAGRLVGADGHPEFVRDVEAVALATQLGPAGLWNLEQVARRLAVRGDAGAVVECGTWKGGALAFFARSFLRQGGDPQRCPLYGFDSFQGMPRMTAADGAGTSRWLYGREIDALEPDLLGGGLVGTGVNLASEAECRALLAATGYPMDKVHIVAGWFQDTLPAWRERIGRIAVLRIDGDFYESTRVCLETLYDAVIPAGIVIIDDYGTFEGCRRATGEFLAKRRAAPELIPIDLGAVYFVKP